MKFKYLSPDAELYLVSSESTVCQTVSSYGIENLNDDGDITDDIE